MRIAAPDSSEYDRGQAELVCNGTNDRTIIQQAFGMENEKVVVSKGTYRADKGANSVDDKPYLYPARGVVVQGEGATFIAQDGICRVMCKKPNAVLSGLTLQGYIHIQNYESNQIFKSLKLSNRLYEKRWLDWRTKGGCTGQLQNWTPKGTTMHSIQIIDCTFEDSYHHGIGFHLSNAQEVGTWKDILISGCTIASPGSGLETDKIQGDRDWACGIVVDTGDIENMMVRDTTVTDSWQSAFHTDGSWNGHSQKVKNLIFENCTAIGAGKRAGKTPKEMYEAGFYLQDAVLKNCITKDCRVGYLIGNVNSGGLTMVNCSDTGSDYGAAIEYGGNKAVVSGLTLKDNTIRSLIVLGQDVKYTGIRVEPAKTMKDRPVLIGRMSKLIYCDSPYHKNDYQRYWNMRYSVSGRFDILSPFTQRGDLVEVWDGSTMNWEGFTMTKIPTTGGGAEPVIETPPPVPVPSEDLTGRLKVRDMFVWVQDDNGEYIQVKGQIPSHLHKKFRHEQVFGPVNV